MCLLSAVIFVTSLHLGYTGNVSINESLIYTGPKSGWCPTECSCILTYHVDCMNAGLGVLRSVIFPANSSNIRSLWLDNNNLTELEASVFKNMKYLRRLSLSNNYVTKLNPHLFSYLSRLKYLDLRNNCLVSPLYNDLFRSLGQLRTLKLDYNKLTTFDSKILTPIANTITDITLSNNPFICDCSIRDTVEWFKTYALSSTATCAYPSAGKSWNTLTFTGNCELMSKPEVDLTICKVSGSVQVGTHKSSDSFPLLLVLVIAINGFLLLLCGGLALYCWRRATRNTTPNLDRMINENKHYDDIRPSDYYYYETVDALSRYTSFLTSSRPDSMPEIPKRPSINRTELQSCQTTRNNDVGNVRKSVSDSDSYVQPENPIADKLLASGESLAQSKVPKGSCDIRTVTGEGTFESTKPLQSLRFKVNVTDEEKGDAISPLPSEAMTPTSAVRYDRPDTIKFQHVQTQKPEYPWSRNSFWRT